MYKFLSGYTVLYFYMTKMGGIYDKNGITDSGDGSTFNDII